MDEVGIPIDQQQLTFAGRTLQDNYTLILQHSEWINPLLESFSRACKPSEQGTWTEGRLGHIRAAFHSKKNS